MVRILGAIVAALGIVATAWEERPLRHLGKDRSSHQEYRAQSSGWYWVYESVAQGQTFTARGARLEQLWLRPARLNALPTGPLRIEVRDLSLRWLYAQAYIMPEESDREFRWMRANWTYRAPLTTGNTYVLLVMSPRSRHSAPWVINAVYDDAYPQGRHLGYADDLFFALAFEVEDVWIGPPRSAYFDVPVNSGMSGGPAAPGPLHLSARHPAVPEAAHDPLGVLPPAIRPFATSTFPLDANTQRYPLIEESRHEKRNKD